MRNHFAIALVLTLLSLSACINYNTAINISTVRIEDMEINQLLHGNSNVENLRAKWSGSTVELYYDLANGTGITKPLSYLSDDEYAYSYRGPNALNTAASIFSMDENSEMTWDEISDLETTNYEDLAFVIWADNGESKYKNMVFISFSFS